MTVAAQDLRRLFRLERATGRLFWNERPVSDFVSPSRAAAWNTKYAGRPADTAIDSSGYRLVCINARRFKAHRVVHAIVAGDWPAEQVDHKDGDRLNNRPENLRAVDIVGNARNRARSRRNTSGTVGVVWASSRGKWEARISMGGSPKHLGYFDCIDSAICARKRAERLYGFHENHGRHAEPCRTSRSPSGE